MSLPTTLPLREFVVSVPVCASTLCLADLLGIFRQKQCERVVVTDEQQRPLGVVELASVLPYWPAPSSGLQQLSEMAVEQQVDLQRSLADLDPTFLQPLVILSANCSLEQFWSRLQAPGATATAWAVVNFSGEFLGVVDPWQILRLFTTPASQSLFLSGSPSGQAHSLIPSLCQLLQQFPLPLMLQTATGQVLTQNSAWRQQVGELEDPQMVQHEAAAILESLPPQPVPEEAYFSGNEEHPAWIWHVPFPAARSAAPVCQPGTEPNTCLCTCPLKNGQERIWQLTKIPLDLRSISAPATPTPSHSAPAFTGSQFRLATLESVSGGMTPGRASAAPPSDHRLSFLDPTRLATEIWKSERDAQQLGQFAPTLSPVGNWSGLAPTETLWLVLAQDCTEEQQVAKELTAKNADLVQLNRLKDEFLACISHELKTPLTAVLGLSSLLKDQVLGELNERQARYSRLIHQSGRQLIAMVNDILDLTRMETGQLDLILEPVPIEAVCHRAFEQACQLKQLEEKIPIAPAETSEITTSFTLEVEPGLETIVADSARLRQMLMNLLSNALKFTEVGGEIGLRVNQWDGWIAFTVWDSGVGIPADKQHLIFQKFQQLETPLTRRFEGTGLGLVLTQRLARLHGGDITFVSQEGQGSQFTILLPPHPPSDARFTLADETQPSAPQPLPHPTGETTNRLVLIVEVVPQFIKTLMEQLVNLGYRPAIARSGTEALEKARRLQPCVIFLNPLLPLLSGWDVLTLLKSDPQTRHLPVIITATQAEKAQAYRNQANGFLSLPIQEKTLQQSLTYLMTRSTWMHQPPGAAKSLTILILSQSHPHAEAEPVSGDLEDLEQTSRMPETGSSLSCTLQLHHHRVIEAEDLAQAELLSRIWKPQVVVLDRSLPEPTILQQISQYPTVSALPLVTLTLEMTQAANQVTGLTVFPCLIPPAETPEALPNHPATTALLQVIQVAAGQRWRPSILVVDVLLLLAEPIQTSLAPMSAAQTLPSFSAEEWVQALVQYIQTAGLQGAIAKTESDIWQKLESQKTDLILICLRQPAPTTAIAPAAWSRLLKALVERHQTGRLPAVVVWNQHPEPETANAWIEPLRPIAAQILPPAVSISSLLEQMRNLLPRSRSPE